MMITEAQISELVAQQCTEENGRFAVSVRVMPGNRIRVAVDSLAGMTVKDCVQVSRHIEGSLDREAEDFELEVGTPGLTEPLRHPLQYVKNVGRTLRIVMQDGTAIKGTLTAAGQGTVTILPEAKKKSKETPQPIGLPLSEIKEAKIVITFN